ncbi:kinase-like protein [Periconia macrospinosa]|uniref:non-specific serine/threonine protein kinase n=1 Tax=Periconia macrospinosa TaxID=97972 RepID=A0A2V1D007_9PLEO|nr:kinase-like protein [Periconia macrospinosa]
MAHPSDIGLELEEKQSISKTEHILNYTSRGYHPVHLNDVICKRYKIIHKLGHDLHSTSWLCSDITAETLKYVTVKIRIAKFSREDYIGELRAKILSRACILSYIDSFEIDGPNGHHNVYVYQVLGPSVMGFYPIPNCENSAAKLRNMCFQATKALAVIHAHTHILCHGDFQPAKIFTPVFGLDGRTEPEVLDILGTPKTVEVLNLSGQAYDLQTTPKYLVEPIDWEKAFSEESSRGLTRGMACLTDLSHSYSDLQPPADIGRSTAYSSPEKVLEIQSSGQANDLWALGCTLFEIRFGLQLFNTKYEQPEDFIEHIKELLDSSKNANNPDYEQVSIREAICQMISESEHPAVQYRGKVTESELALFANLLSKLLKPDPKQRISAREALKNDWFKLPRAW